MLRSLVVIVGIATLLIGCSKDPFDLVDDELKPYLELFKQEAAARKIIVDYEQRPIEARIRLESEDLRLGWCNYDFDTHNSVTINALFWDLHDDLEKEKIVFHELGHCMLYRPHLDTKRSDGFCRSIMHSGQACADNYTLETREDYLDELFLR